MNSPKMVTIRALGFTWSLYERFVVGEEMKIWMRIRRLLVIRQKICAI